MPRPLAVLGITYFFCLAILLKFSLKAALVALIVALCMFVISFVIKDLKKSKVLPTAFFSLALAAITVIISNNYLYEPSLKLVGEKVDIHAQIVDLPQENNGRYYYIVKTTEDGVKVRLSSKTLLDAQPYDYVDLNATVYVLGGDESAVKEYHKSNGVFIGAYTFDEIEITQAEKRPFFYHILMLRQFIKDAVYDFLPNENGSLIIGLLLGDKSGLENETKQNFSFTGVYHLFTVSGLHMSVWVMSFLALLEFLKIKRRTAALISMCFVFLLFGLTGFSFPCLRAGFMHLVLLLGYVIKRKPDSLNSLGLAILIITLINPFAALSVSLQLSFLATLGIVTLSAPLYNSILKHKTIKVFSEFFLIKAIFKIICMTISATIFTMPVVINSFGTISLIAPLSNIFLLYPATLTMILGGLGAIMSSLSIFAFVSNPLMLFAGLISKYMLWCTRLLGSMPFASVSVNEEYINVWLAGVLILLGITFLLYKSKGFFAIRLTSILCVITLLVGILSHSILFRNVTKITVADNGNGTCIVITKDAHAFMIGCGGDYFSAVNGVDILNENAVKHFDVMLIPRLNDTEYNAVVDVIKQTDVKHLITPQTNNELEFFGFSRGLTATKDADINLWDSVYCKYEVGTDYCYAYIDIDGTTVLCVFNAGCNLNKIPKEYQNSDVLICRSEPPLGLELSEYKKVIISADSEKYEALTNSQRMKDIDFEITSGLGNIEVLTNGDSSLSIRRQS
ncbi:MAG TPA: ComEC/Rec2 family competence protein [Clostridia bacterium]|nr:ComEC/Rec2 family competence protein [Clostridia bacterium]